MNYVIFAVHFQEIIIVLQFYSVNWQTVYLQKNRISIAHPYDEYIWLIIILMHLFNSWNVIYYLFCTQQ